MESGNPAEGFVDEEIPQTIRHVFPAALRRAYSAADDTIDRHPYLATPGGKYQRGDLVMLAASYEFEQLIKSGNLPYDGTWEDFARPTGKHFVMLSKRSRITTNQIDDPSKKPRMAVHRDNYAEDNERFLFEFMNSRVDDTARRLIHIVHGYQELSFAHITYPHPDRNRNIYRSPNLMKIPHEIVVGGGLPPQEGPAESPDPEVLENIERHLRDE